MKARAWIAALVLEWSLCVPAGEATAQTRTVEEGFRLLEADRASQASEHFDEILRGDPRNLGAIEGLVWARLALGDISGAARAADRRLALRPDDVPWQRKRLGILAQLPSRREEACAGYRMLLRDRPDDAELWIELGRTLSWMDGRQREALDAYRTAAELAPGSRDAQLGLGRTLSWTGDLEESASVLDGLLAEYPNDAEALVARAQVALWSGDLKAAAGLARSARAVDPDSEAALAVLREIEDRTRTHVGTRITYSSESSSFERLVIGAPRLEFHPWPATRLRLDGGYSWFRDDDDEIERASIGGSLRHGLPLDLHLDIFYTYHHPRGVAATHEWDLGAGWSPSGRGLTLRAGARRRAIVDEARGYEDVAYLHSVGSGGTSIEGIEERIQVLEGYSGVTLAPFPFLYAYADGTYGWLDDDLDNRRRSISAGFGLNLLRLPDVLRDHDLTLKYDYFHLSFRRSSDLYFSPGAFHVHTPGLEYRIRFARRSVAGLEGGVPMRVGKPVGYLAGAFARLFFGERFYVEARGRVIDDTEFRIESVTGSAGILL